MQLLQNWAETGRPVSEFFELTLGQIAIVFDGFYSIETRRAGLATNLAAYQVWRLAGLMRVKKLPKKPDDLLKEKKRQVGSGADWRAQKAAIEMFNSAIGGFDNRKIDKV